MEESGSEAQLLEPVKYQCLDCLAMFYSPETWLEHRRSHSRSSTHSNAETTVKDRTHPKEIIFPFDFLITIMITKRSFLS